MWTTVSSLLVVVAAGCGSVASTPDGPSPDSSQSQSDGPPDTAPLRCSPGAAFGTPVVLDTLNTDFNDEAGYLSSDELVIYFSSDRLGGVGGYDIYRAERASRADSFGAPVLVEGVNTGMDQRRPSFSEGELVLYLGQGTPPDALLRATRTDVGQPFFTPTVVAELDQNGLERDPYIFADHHAIYFISDRVGNNTNIHRASYDQNTSMFGTPVMPQGTGLASADRELYPVASNDERTLFFASNRPGVGALDIWVATRATATDPFDAPVNVAELNTSDGEFPSWLSEDGCVLYVTQMAPIGTNDLYVATRGQ